jgi:Tfp pilus assembly protein PilN
MRAVNLLPSERSPQADPRAGAVRGGVLTSTRVAIAGAGLALAVSGVVGYTFVGARNDAAEKREALAAVQEQVARAEAEAEAAARANQQSAGPVLPADVKAQLDAFRMVESTRMQWDLLLGDVSRVLPSGSWLSSLTLQGMPSTATGTTTSTPVPGATPTGFVATGYALSHNTVARLMQRLAVVPMLSDITLQRSEKANVGADEAFQFTLSANVRLNGAGS